jgi:hypothetical protein
MHPQDRRIVGADQNSDPVATIARRLAQTPRCAATRMGRSAIADRRWNAAATAAGRCAAAALP